MFDSNNNCELKSVKSGVDADGMDMSSSEKTSKTMSSQSSQFAQNRETTTNAVDVRRVAFKYQQNEVLKDINIAVPHKQIYALLGPSGSGKTTLLRLILGRIKPKSGSIYVFGNSRPGAHNRTIGYMPQDKALSPELTIGETIDYFASLHGVTQRRLLQQKADLRRVLQLSPDDQVVSTLSGGQQKALSLALVFLHSPRLVILDEPTVGTDPLLGDQIWDYLRTNCDQGLSVIIVTHYIQEAALAQSVGMMRSGRIIEEGSPASLYTKYVENDLEKIFIKICTDKTLLQQQSQAQKLKGAEALQQNLSEFLSYEEPEFELKIVNGKHTGKLNTLVNGNGEYHEDNNMAYFWLLFILVRRNIQKFFASKLSAILLLSPVYCTLLMCMTFKVDKAYLPVAVFDQHQSGPGLYSARFEQIAKNFSRYHFDYKHVKSREDAYKLVESGKALAALMFDSNFSESLEIRALASTAQQVQHHKKHSLNDHFDTETVSTTTSTTTSATEEFVENSEDVETTSSEEMRIIPVKNNAKIMSNPEPKQPTEEESSTIPATLPIEEKSDKDSFSLRMTTDIPISGDDAEETTSKSFFSTDSRNKRATDADEEDDDITTTETHESTKEDEEEEEESEHEEEEDSENVDEPEHGRISNATLEASSIKILLDNSNAIVSRPAFDLLQYSTWSLFNEIIKKNGRYPLTNPVVVQEVIYAENTDAPDFLLSGYMIGFLYLSQVTLTAQLLIQERKDGFFDRAIVAGAKHSLMFFSHFITNMIFAMFQTVLMSFIGFYWYKIPNFGSYSLVFTLVMLQSASSIMTGLFISSVCKENFAAFFVALSITLSQLFTSGAVFPIISFDPLLKTLMNLSPIAMPVESLRNVMLRGWDLSHYHVAHGFTTNIVTTLLFGTLALVFFIRNS